MSSVEFSEGTTIADIEPLRYDQLIYRPLSDDFEPHRDHEPEGDDLYRVTGPASIQELNGADLELVEAIKYDGGFNQNLVTDMAAVMQLNEITTDRKRAHHTYRAIKRAGEGPFLATPNGEIHVCDTGVWKGHPHGENRLRQLAGMVLGQEYGGNTLSELTERVRMVDTEPREQLGRPAGTVATPDGLMALTADAEVDIEQGETRKIRPDDYVQARIEATPDPEGYADSRWREFVETAIPDPTERAKAQEYTGYTLLPGQRFKKALFAVGPTDSGKGTFLKAITAVLGSDNVAHQSLKSLLDSDWGTDKIFGKMANLDNEVSPKAIGRIEEFKRLTGGEDPVTAQKKHEPTYEFIVKQKFIWATNQFPSVSHADEAFWNRCLFVEFPDTIPADEQDRGLLNTLQDERGVILAWMLEGLEGLLEAGQFTGERTIDERRSLTQSFGAPTEQFVYEALDVTGEPDDVLAQKDLYEAFTRFCHFMEFDETPVKQTFTKRLKRRPGVSTGESRRLESHPDEDDKVSVYKGLRANRQVFKEIQAGYPRHATAE